jgi:hypothetical protein
MYGGSAGLPVVDGSDMPAREPPDQRQALFLPKRVRHFLCWGLEGSIRSGVFGFAALKRREISGCCLLGADWKMMTEKRQERFHR